ncbi:MAG: M1 family metallopeptidase [Bacteroidetes bacterium]|nr:M1 family metallopeptidase [Bacteroidota bacterium]
MRLISFIALSVLFFSCFSNKNNQPVSFEPIEFRDLDTLTVDAPMPSALKNPEDYVLPVYQASSERKTDLLHTQLHLKFDWENETVIGKALLHLKPYFDTIQMVTLDAKQLRVSEVQLQLKNQIFPIPFHHSGNQIHVYLGRSFNRNEDFRLSVTYTASPSSTGGSAAITSNKGLFFINPKGTDRNKPKQIWTQGETNWNSRWYPTIDHPNERATQEINLTVDSMYVTLSNGKLVSSTSDGNGFRTDKWVMDQPHAPYLTMIAVGEYAIVREKWNEIELSYYVEPAFEAHAKHIFPHTKEMMDFFSTLLGYPYPWSKYAQIIVRDYVSGAMENTTASVFGEFMQRTSRDLIDVRENEKTVAHELFHHWFGDLVTCESWSNLTLNEGFANYSEYLWFEYKYGREEADYHLMNEWQGYFSEVSYNLHPLIHFHYQDNEEMFDAHSYNKGGSVLHILRHYLGDEAFFQGLNRYLNKNSFQSVETHHLRLAFEEVTGKDLNWFFNQWYFERGHPDLNIDYEYQPNLQKLVVKVSQTQHPDRMLPIFILPTSIGIRTGDSLHIEKIWINKRTQVFEFPLATAPDWVTIDPYRILPAEFKDNKTSEDLVNQFLFSPSVIDRMDALNRISENSTSQIDQLYLPALTDSFWAIRKKALSVVPEERKEELISTIINMATKDPHSEVRSGAIEVLLKWNVESVDEIAIKTINNDSSYVSIAASLQVLFQRNNPQTAIYTQKLESESHPAILNAVGMIYANQKVPGKLSFFRENLNKISDFEILAFYEAFLLYGLYTGPENTAEVIDDLRKIIFQFDSLPWKRLGGMATLNNLRNLYREEANKSTNGQEKVALEKKVTEISGWMEEAMSKEQLTELKNVYTQLQLVEKE